jgi:hypothetical protein
VIRRLTESDFERIFSVINDGVVLADARAFARGIVAE